MRLLSMTSTSSAQTDGQSCGHTDGRLTMPGTAFIAPPTVLSRVAPPADGNLSVGRRAQLHATHHSINRNARLVRPKAALRPLARGCLPSPPSLSSKWRAGLAAWLPGLSSWPRIIGVETLLDPTPR